MSEQGVRGVRGELQVIVATLMRTLLEEHPTLLEKRQREDPSRELDNFRWSTPVGGMDNVPDFLEFRRERMEELFEKRYAALRISEDR